MEQDFGSQDKGTGGNIVCLNDISEIEDFLQKQQDRISKENSLDYYDEHLQSSRYQKEDNTEFK